MRIAATSDFHGRGFPDVPACDLLLIAGDWSPADGRLEEWLLRTPAQEIVAVAGNHDYAAEREPEVVRSFPWTYLQDESCVVDDLVIHGAPWSNLFFDWAFMGTDAELAERWALIPDDCDVLVTHGPALGFGDAVARGERVGSASLADRIGKLPKLKLHVCGHIHEDSGVWVDEGGLVRANSAWVNERYQPAHPVLLFDYDGERIVPAAAEQALV